MTPIICTVGIAPRQRFYECHLPALFDYTDGLISTAEFTAELEEFYQEARLPYGPLEGFAPEPRWRPAGLQKVFRLEDGAFVYLCECEEGNYYVEF